jgi:hypothetical protein
MIERACPHCGTPIRIPPPEKVVAYLERTGWKLIEKAYAERWLQFEKNHGRSYEDVMDVFRNGIDEFYAEYMMPSLKHLARLEQRPIPAIVEEMSQC